MNIKHKYKSILFIPNHLNDGISAMEIFDDLLLVGTYMGYTKLGYINPKSNLNNTSNTINNNCSSSFIMSQITTLTELEAENISCVGFEGRQYANIGIGDYEILKIDISKEFNSDELVSIGDRINYNLRKSVAISFNSTDATNKLYNPVFSQHYVFTTANVKWV